MGISWNGWYYDISCINIKIYEMPAKVISAAPSLKMICVAATGYEWVDMNESKQRNIVVSNSPGYSTEAVAEHTIGLLLRSIRNASMAEKELLSGNWDPAKYKGKELKGKTLGIIGYGSIGCRVAEIVENGFNMNILYVNASSTKDDINKLLKESDFISVNAPLTEKTKGMISNNEFALMKKNVVIVNTANCIIKNVTETDSLPHEKMYSK